MRHRLQLWLLLSCLLIAGLACAETEDPGCQSDEECGEGKICSSTGRCVNRTTFRPPVPVEDAGFVPQPDIGISVDPDGGPDSGTAEGPDTGTVGGPDAGTPTRPAGLVPSGNPEWTIILNGDTWVLTEFSEFMMQPAMGSCYFIGFNLDRARSEGPVSGGADGPAQGHSGWSQWYGLANYGYSSQCAVDYSAELTLGGTTYMLNGELMKTISRGSTGSGGPSVIGNWSDGVRNGSFELYDYVR